MNPVVIVTGASRGIGAATAVLAGSSGFAVCVNYRHDRDAALSVVEKIQANGGQAVAVAADVSKPDDAERLFGTACDELGNITALVNNAGVLEAQSDFTNIGVDRLKRVIDTNLVGVFNCTQEAIKRMARSNGGAGGAIVNISSVAARTGAAHEYVDYAASKGALDSLTTGVAKEVAPEGIRVNTVRPGFIYTEMHASGGEPDRVDRLAKSIPLQRGGEPEEVAKVIVWLLSENSRYVVGASVDVTGGV